MSLGLSVMCLEGGGVLRAECPEGGGVLRAECNGSGGWRCP